MNDTPRFVPARGNLSRWAIEHPALVRFFIVLILLVGVRLCGPIFSWGRPKIRRSPSRPC